MKSIPVLTTVLVLLLPAVAQAGVLENHTALVSAADDLLSVQFADGSFPWIIGQAGKYQNIQGVTAIAMLDAFKLTADTRYLDSAAANRDWLAAYMSANPTAYISGSNAYFLAEYALLSTNVDDLELARAAFATAIARYGSPAGIASGIIQARANQGHGNLGLWDVGLFVRAAQDIGDVAAADEIAATMRDQTIVDPMNANANYYEMGLAGTLFGYGEASLVDNLDGMFAARDALLASRCENGSYPTTYGGVVYCDDVQSTAYAVDGLTYIGALVEAQAGCDHIAASQVDGGWDLGGYEIAEINAEAASALAQCILPARNGATSYADEARALL